MIVKELEKVLKTLNIKADRQFKPSAYILVSDGIATVDNLEIRISVEVPLSMEACIPVKWLKDTLKLLPKDSEVVFNTAILEVGKHNIVLESNGFSFQTLTLNPEEFPKSPEANNRKFDEGIHTLTSEDVENIKLASLSAGTDTLRPVLTAVYIGNDIVATNGGFVLVINPISIKSEIPYLIPHHLVKHLEGAYSVEIKMQAEIASRIKLTKLGSTVYIKCVEGIFPNYRAVLPTSYREVVEVDGIALLKTLKSLPKNIEIIKFTLDKITNATSEVEFSIPLNIGVSAINEDIIFMVAPSLLVQLLSSQSGRYIELGFTSSTQAIKFGNGIVLPCV